MSNDQFRTWDLIGNWDLVIGNLNLRLMDKKQAKLRAEKLQKQINELRYRYHVLDDPAVTDEVYDSLSRDLRDLESEFPDLAAKDSPTQRVGGKALDKFVKV